MTAVCDRLLIMSRVAQDVLGVLRGLQNVASAAVRYQESQVTEKWLNSSIKDAVGNVGGKVGSSVVHSLSPQPSKDQTGVSKKITEIVERTSMVTEGIRTFAAYAGSPAVREETRNLTNEELQELSELNMYDESNLCHLEVRDPNPPEIIAEKFESKAQAVLDSISTQTTSSSPKSSSQQKKCQGCLTTKTISIEHS